MFLLCEINMKINYLYLSILICRAGSKNYFIYYLEQFIIFSLSTIHYIGTIDTWKLI